MNAILKPTRIAPPPGLRCRICGSEAAREIGSLECYQGYELSVYDCAWCGCRYTEHDSGFYDLLHAVDGSSYSRYRVLQEKCRRCFTTGDLAGLRGILASSPKYRFICDAVDGLPDRAKVLEVGCAQGSLASYAILSGHDLLGVDVSDTALEEARSAFGDHFDVNTSSKIKESGPYDFIYHVGTIGCVGDPVGLNTGLLAMLKPGGRLLFNAPNRGSCNQVGQIWLESAPPPDVVTLFPQCFWQRQFMRCAVVSEKIGMFSPDVSLRRRMRKLLRRKWQKPMPQAVQDSRNDFLPPPTMQRLVYDFVERLMVKAANVTGMARVVKPEADDFGLFVTVIKR